MMVTLHLCRRHGGSFRRFGATGTERIRCLACDMERRKMREKMETGGVFPCEVQVDPRPLGWLDGWQTLEEHFRTVEEAEQRLDALHDVFPKSRLRVISVVRIAEPKEDRDGI